MHPSTSAIGDGEGADGAVRDQLEGAAESGGELASRDAHYA